MSKRRTEKIINSWAGQKSTVVPSDDIIGIYVDLETRVLFSFDPLRRHAQLRGLTEAPKISSMAEGTFRT